MFFGIGVLSMLTATIASFFVELKLKSERGMDSLKVKNHFIICEWNQRAETIYAELRSDPRSARTPIVLLCVGLDQKPVDDDNFFFVHGEITEESLERVNIQQASTVVILGDDTLQPGPRDAKVVLSVLTVEAVAPQVYSIVELVRGENARHCERAQADEIIVTDEFGSRMIASAAIDHGISRVVSELLSARFGNDLQRVPVPHDLASKPFLAVSTAMKEVQGCIVLALERGREVITNPPKDFLIEASDFLVVIADRSGSRA
jgi:voltage-gated potassium channel